MTTSTVVILRSGTIWTVPWNWNSNTNTVICIGGGAGGNGGSANGGGGGGGARAVSTNLNLTPGSNVSFQIGAGGASGSSGGDTSFNSGAIIAKGGSTGSNGTGGAGGSAASSTGTTKYSGGNGGNASAGNGGGGGGAAGDAGNGSNGATTNGGAGGINDGGNGSILISGTGWAGFDLGNQDTRYGSNYAGGGGGGGAPGPGGEDGNDASNGGAGASFGGGGGGGGIDIGTDGAGGIGGVGAIIVSWNWEGKIKASGQLAMSEIKATLDENYANTSLNETSMRTLAGIPSGQIAISNFYSKTPNATFIASSSSGTSVPNTTTTLPSGWEVRDMCILAVTHYNQETFINQDGWFYVGKSLSNSSLLRLNVFYRILQAGDTAPSFTTAPQAWQMLLFRKASRLTNKQVVNNYGFFGTTLPLTGFTKISDSRRIVSIVADTFYFSYPTPAPPAGWTTHVVNGQAIYQGSQISSASVPSSSYTNGSTVTWTNFDSGYTQGGILFELE
jgi:hypothetical protein